MKFHIHIKTPATQDEITTVETGLQNYNKQSSTIGEVRSLHVTATANDGTVYGGALGRTWGTCCELQELWIDAKHRGKGVG